MIRIPYERWDDHPKCKEFRPWHIVIFVVFSFRNLISMVESSARTVHEPLSMARQPTACRTSSRALSIARIRKKKGRTLNTSNSFLQLICWIMLVRLDFGGGTKKDRAICMLGCGHCPHLSYCNPCLKNGPIKVGHFCYPLGSTNIAGWKIHHE